MTTDFKVEDFENKMDSFYRLVIVAARRANMLSKPETRPLVETEFRKPTMVALQEIVEGKVGARPDADEDEELFE